MLVVTLVNSAVDNFSQRIGGFWSRAKAAARPGLPRAHPARAGARYRARAARLVSLANDFSIIDEREADAIREQVALAWLRANPDFFDDYLDPELSEYKLDEIRAQRARPRWCRASR